MCNCVIYLIRLPTQGVGGGQPSASDMFELKWSNELAHVAQRWADQCMWHHDLQRVNEAFLNLGVLNSY